MGAGKTLTGEGDLTLVATAGGITEKTGTGYDGKVQIDMDDDNKTLTITQLDPINTLETGFVVTNDEHTALDITSTGGLIKSTMAGDWKSIAANASGDLTLTNLTTDNAITIGNLTSGGEIWVQSKASLTTPATATITANGAYAVANDDRNTFHLLSTGDRSGNPIDVAIYIGSYDFTTKTGGNVAVGSTIVMAANGTMVIDAQDTVTDWATIAGENFTGSAPWNSGTTNRLELVSRKSLSIDDAINNSRLPHASEVRGKSTPSWFPGPMTATGRNYVLRGNGDPAEVLAKIDAVPVVPPIQMEVEIEEIEEQEDPTGDVIKELGPEFLVRAKPEDAYDGLFDTDVPEPMKKIYRKIWDSIVVLKNITKEDCSGLDRLAQKYEKVTMENVGQLEKELKTMAIYEWINSAVDFTRISTANLDVTREMCQGKVFSNYFDKVTDDREIRGFIREILAIYLEMSEVKMASIESKNTNEAFACTTGIAGLGLQFLVVKFGSV